jgi:hypothetical protein
MFFEYPCEKQLVGLVCLVKKIDNALAPTSIEKGFTVKKIKDLDVKAILEKWIKCKELIELEREDTTRNSQEVLNTLQQWLRTPL